MNFKLAMLGCQSIHAEKFATLFNVENLFPGWQIKYIYGDDAPEKVLPVAKTGLIPEICNTQEEALAKCDALLITYRDSSRHYLPALYCLNRGKPVFVDKPFTFACAEAARLIDLSLKQAVILRGGSTLCSDPQLKNAKKQLAAATCGLICYRADYNSQFGGYRFYGSHLTDLCAVAFGTDAIAVRSMRQENYINTTVRYPEKSVTLHSQLDFSHPYIIYNAANDLNQIELDENECYKNGMTDFVNAVNSRFIDYDSLRCLQFSVNLLNSLIRSLETGREVKLTKINLPQPGQ